MMYLMPVLVSLVYAIFTHAYAQECSYRTDAPRFISKGHIHSVYKERAVSIVKGKVFTQTNEEIPRSTVILSRLEKDGYVFVGATLTDTSGRFCFGTMPDGNYKLEFSARDFNSAEVLFKVRFDSRNEKTLKVTLEVGT